MTLPATCRRSKPHRLALLALLLAARSLLAAPPAPPCLDLSKDPTLYAVGYSHLDTQWRWSYPQVIREYIPNTLWDNFPLLRKYPHYVFNFTGANRYRMMEEYYPAGFDEVRRWVDRGRWVPAGSAWEECDVLIPSTESLIRQILYGQRYFEQAFKQNSLEFTLPDCFGFSASLPSVLAHCGVRGFSTQKLTWGSAVGIPFNLGVWEGPDGQSVIAAFNCGPYVGTLREDLSRSEPLLKRLRDNGAKGGVFADFRFYGVGDRGGAPDEESVAWLEKSLASTGRVRVVSARDDQIFRDISDTQKARLPRYKGDLLLTQHSAGSLTSQAYMKRWNRQNELLAEAAEKASVAAHLLGAAPYPREKLRRAWELVLGAQAHDIITGTSLPVCYEYSWNDEIVALNCFASVLQDAVGGVARALDTQVDGIPMVVFNPLSIDREDVVEAEIDLPVPASAISVCDPHGAAVPTQILSVDGARHRILFLARVPSIGFAIYTLKSTAAPQESSSLRVTDRSLENARFRVEINDAGDIAAIFDKSANRQLLDAPARLALLNEDPAQWPAWNMDWKDRRKPPRGYVGGPAKIRVAERGPVRVGIEIERETEGSLFVQTVRLAAGASGERVEVANRIDWQSSACSLKAEFPLTVCNTLATYNWGLGRVQRSSNDSKKYEVPSHGWFDLTDPRVDYGVSVLTDAKYGSDKPDGRTLRLTLLYTPATHNSYAEQRYQDWGRHEFVYGVAGHRGDWRAGKSDWQAARLSQPLLAFRTASHPGQLGRAISLLQSSSDQVAIRTVKLAEDNDRVIIRLQELNDSTAGGVTLRALAGFSAASEVNGLERSPRPLKTSNRTLSLDFKPAQIRSLACSLRAPLRLAAPRSAPLPLPYDLDIFSFNDIRQDGACDDRAATIPAEMIGDAVVSEGISFRVGPRQNGMLNALSCTGQKLALPPGDFNRIYLLALAVKGDASATFVVDGQPAALTVGDWSGYLGSWDNRIFKGRVDPTSHAINNPLDRIAPAYVKRAPLAWFCSHRHRRDGADDPYKFSYMFKCRLDLPPGARTLTLPDNPRIRLVGVSLAHNQNDNTVPIQPLYDDFSGWKPIVLKAQSAY